MAQRPALSVAAMDAADDLAREYANRAADGELCAIDIAHLTPKIHLVQVATQRVDLAQAAGLAMIRGGETAQRARGLFREVATFMPFEPEAA